MAQPASAAPDAASDPRIDPEIRSFLAEIDKDSSPFWELPQPKPQEILSGLQSQTAVEMSGVTTTERTISHDGRSVRLYVMTPERASGTRGVLLFLHGGVWIVGNFDNHKRLLRDLVVGSGQVGVFVEYTSLPEARFPTQLDQSYAALKWVAAHAGEFGADGSRIGITHDRLKKVEEFFDRHGDVVITFARFVVLLRQFNGIVAGTLEMNWARFLLFNAIGAALWVGFWGLLAYWLGKRIFVVVNALGAAEPMLIGLGIVAALLIAAYMFWFRPRQKAHKRRTAPPQHRDGP